MKKYLDAIYAPIVVSYAVGQVLGDLLAVAVNKMLPAEWKIR